MKIKPSTLKLNVLILSSFTVSHRKENSYRLTCWRKSTRLLQSKFAGLDSCSSCISSIVSDHLCIVNTSSALFSRKQKDSEDEGKTTTSHTFVRCCPEWRRRLSRVRLTMTCVFCRPPAEEEEEEEGGDESRRKNKKRGKLEHSRK